MRLFALPFLLMTFLLASLPVGAKESAPKSETISTDALEITADDSLEWYQEQHIYVARGNAKAVRDDRVVQADLLSAHQREGKSSKPGDSDLDRLTAEGHVRITDSRQRILGDHAVDDLDKHVAIITGKNLKYETEKQTVTATDSLEYWDEKKMAVARGHAVAIGGDRHVEADTLTAEFRDAPNGDPELWKLTAIGHVAVITKNDITRGDRAVYDITRNIAVISGNVRITRNDGTQLTGDVAEADFTNNQSRLMNQGHGRVRVLLVPKSSGKAGPL
jgi:lipopolysaccharide export system protein LptA